MFSMFKYQVLMTVIKMISEFFKLIVVFRAILILDLLNNTLYMIEFSSSIKILIFDGTI